MKKSILWGIALVALLITVVISLWSIVRPPANPFFENESNTEKVFYADTTTGFQILTTPTIVASGYAVVASTSSYYEGGYTYITYIPAFQDDRFQLGKIDAVPVKGYQAMDCTGEPVCSEPLEIGKNSKYVFLYTPYPPHDGSPYCLDYPDSSHIPMSEKVEFTENNSAFCDYYDELRKLEMELKIFSVSETD